MLDFERLANVNADIIKDAYDDNANTITHYVDYLRDTLRKREEGKFIEQNEQGQQAQIIETANHNNGK
jgi:hypothetical protein